MPGFALDTNVLVYVEGLERAPSDAVKVRSSRRLVDTLTVSRTRTVVAVQVLAELHYVLVRRLARTPAQATVIVSDWSSQSEVVTGTRTTLTAALGLAVEHKLPIFDALILAAAAEAGCDVLLSEDFQGGFRWGGVTVVNPFAPSPDPRVARLL